MGTKTKDGPETLTTVHYSPRLQSIVLLFKRDNGIFVTVDLEKTRLSISEKDLHKYLIVSNYELIGAFYEN